MYILVHEIHKIISIITVKEGKGGGGFWRTKVEWKANWVKHWEVKKVSIYSCLLI